MKVCLLVFLIFTVFAETQENLYSLLNVGEDATS